MNIVDAYWDTRNLGVKTYEIVVNDGDEYSTFEKAFCELKDVHHAEYVVVKTPPSLSEFLFKLPKLGFVFIETIHRLRLDKKNYTYPKFIERFEKDVEIRNIDAKGLERIIHESKKGLFDTDRISIDPHFSEQASGVRSANWIEDVIQQGGFCYELFQKEKPIGFFLFKAFDNGSVEGILTALYESYQSSGYGVLLMKKLKDCVWDKGFKRYYAQVSTNNIKALRSNLIFGSEIENAQYTYVFNLKTKA